MVSVLDEVQAADAVHLDRRNRHGRRDPADAGPVEPTSRTGRAFGISSNLGLSGRTSTRSREVGPLVAYLNDRPVSQPPADLPGDSPPGDPRPLLRSRQGHRMPPDHTPQPAHPARRMGRARPHHRTGFAIYAL